MVDPGMTFFLIALAPCKQHAMSRLHTACTDFCSRDVRILSQITSDSMTAAIAVSGISK
jgi:hypothetical protein